jgi:hypothetical protein
MACVPATWRAWATRPLSPLGDPPEWDRSTDQAPVLLSCVLCEGPDAVRAASHAAETLRQWEDAEAEQDIVCSLDDIPAMLMMRQVRPDLLFRLVRATATAYPATLVAGAWLAEAAAVYRSTRYATERPAPDASRRPLVPWDDHTHVTAGMLEQWCAPNDTDDTHAARARQERLFARLAMKTTPGGVPPREGGTVMALRRRAGRCAMVSATAAELPLPSKATPGDVLTHLAGRRRLRDEVREAAQRLGGLDKGGAP